MSKSTELAEAIEEFLNGQNFGMEFEAQRRAAPFAVSELEDLATLRVSVFTGATKAERITRGKFQRVYKPLIAIQQRIVSEDDETALVKVDTLEDLAEEIEKALESEGFAGLAFLGFDEEQDRELYNAELLQNLKVFARVIALEYSD